jgi:hypothetical protein
MADEATKSEQASTTQQTHRRRYNMKPLPFYEPSIFSTFKRIVFYHSIATEGTGKIFAGCFLFFVAIDERLARRSRPAPLALHLSPWKPKARHQSRLSSDSGRAPFSTSR